MAKTEVVKPTETSVARPRDIFSAMRQEMDRMFERFELGLPRWSTPFLPAAAAAGTMLPELDVRENANAITIEAELPGVDEKDVSVTMANGVLTIKGEKKQEKEEKDERYHRVERTYGAFTRSVRLPVAVDASRVTAGFKNGLLTVTLPKTPAAKGTMIPIKAE